MNKKTSKRLKRLSLFIANKNGKTIEDAEKIYKNLKKVHKENKKTPR